MEGSDTGYEPGFALQNSNDSHYLQKIFPEEILTKAHWSTREVAYHSSSYLRHLLYPTRQIFLFPQVYKLIGAKFEYGPEPAYHTNSEPKNIWVRNILNLRLVCKDWCSGIEHFYETCYPLYSFDQSVFQARVDFGLDTMEEHIREMYYCEDLGSWLHYEFCADARFAGNINYFLQQFTESHGPNVNPFIGRCVVFDGGSGRLRYDLTQEQAQSFLSDILKILGKYVLNRICEYLVLMPNLKVFRLVSHDKLREEPRVQFDGHGFPKLPNLNLLSFGTTPEFFIQEFLLANPHISRLELWRKAHIDLNSVHLPNLRHLVIYVESAPKFEMLETCTQTWPLLTLHVQISEIIPFFPRERIFRFLEKWGDSLTDVMVYMPTAQTNEQRIIVYTDNQIRLNLPKLKRFGVHFPNISGIDFMLPMKALELFEVSTEYKDWDNDALSDELCDQVDNERVIDFSVAHNFDICDIWNFFPNLKRIHSSRAEDPKFFESEAFRRGVWETPKRSRLSGQPKNDSS